MKEKLVSSPGGQYNLIGTVERFSGEGTRGEFNPPSQSTFPMIIKGEVTQTWEGEWANDLLYKFQISPLAQDLQGNDRVFTFAYYTTKPKRATPKHSDERKLIARNLRKHHTLIWLRFHAAMDRP